MFQLLRCDDCQFVFVANPKGETFEAVQNAPMCVPEKARHRQIKRICDAVFARNDVSVGIRRIAEVGAGWGGLAQVFARDDRYRYTGLEPSAARAAFCRAQGFDVREGFFEGARSLNGPVDAIVFDNVIEHVWDPVGLIRSAVDALHDGGLLIVIVPNADDIRQWRKSWRERHHWQPHCHINYFTVGHLRGLFERNGLKMKFFGLDAVGKAGDDFPLLPRVLVDILGWHPLGLNVYGIKTASGT